LRRWMPRAVRRSGLSVTAALGLAVTALVAAPGAQAAAPAAHGVPTARACAVSRARSASCDALRVTGGTVAARATVPTPLAAPAGYGPADLRSAYAFPANGGAGSTVALIDAYDDPNAAADLAVYRSTFGLPACTVANGCFRKVSQTGSATALPAPDAGWAEEESLDVDMVSAVAPNAHVLLVEANSASMADLGAAENEAVALGARFLSNSWGAAESSQDTAYDAEYFDHPGVVITASAGDAGYGVEYPASSPYVIAAGGTSLTRSSTSKRGWLETAWSGSGSGCSAFEPKPSWQKDTGCARRTVVDVAAVADPATGVAVYDTYGGDTGWEVFGGTSAAAPILAALFADAGTPPAGSSPASFPYAHPSGLNDITSGSDGTCGGGYLCTAGTGYDGPTGLGSPNGLTAFTG
jgi:subtilase family serine protease